MQTSALMPTCGLLASSSEVARQWLVQFAEICQKPITPALAEIWSEQLKDMPAELLDRACDRLAKTWTTGFLPTPGNVRAQIENANSAGLELEAAEAWERWFAHVQKYFHVDLGWDRHAPHLDAITEHAGRAAGGAHWIECCPEKELHWCRTRFLDAYLLAHRTGQDQHLLTRGEAKAILTRLAAPVTKPTAALPVVTQTVSTAMRDQAVDAAFEEARKKIDSPRPAPAPISTDEWQRRKRAQREALNRYVSEHSELTPKEELQSAPAPRQVEPESLSDALWEIRERRKMNRQDS